MEGLRISIRPTSSFESSLMSDTLFGNFCWVFLELYSQERVEKLMKIYDKKPFLVFSDGFPHGFLPKPFLKPRKPKGTFDIKAFKKVAFVRSQKLLELRSDLDEQRLFDVVSDKGPKDIGVPVKVFRNAVDRVKNTASSLYHCVEVFFPRNAIFDIYLKYDSSLIERDEILRTMDAMGSLGFGKDVSVGKGKFEIVEVEEDPEILEDLPGANSFISLSHGIPDDSIKDGFFKIKTKFPKHGGYLAVQANPFKNPLILTIPGSTFIFSEKRDVYGRAVKISPNLGPHIHSCYMIPFFVRLREVEIGC